MYRWGPKHRITTKNQHHLYIKQLICVEMVCLHLHLKGLLNLVQVHFPFVVDIEFGFIEFQRVEFIE